MAQSHESLLAAKRRYRTSVTSFRAVVTDGLTLPNIPL